MDYMNDLVRIADTEEDIQKMAIIQSEFVQWARMRFAIPKCAYWGRYFERYKEEYVILEHFTLCGDAILHLEGLEAFKYLREHKASAFAKLNEKLIMPCVPNKEKPKRMKERGPWPNTRHTWCNLTLYAYRNYTTRKARLSVASRKAANRDSMSHESAI